MTGTKFGVFQKGGIRYQRKPYLCAITDTEAQANLIAATINNSYVAAFINWPLPNSDGTTTGSGAIVLSSITDSKADLIAGKVPDSQLPLANVTSATITELVGGTTSLDLPIVAAASDELNILMSGNRTASQVWQMLRVNGVAATVFGGAKNIGAFATWTGELFLMGVAGGNYEGGGCRIKLGAAVSGKRDIEVSLWGKNAAGCGVISGIITVGAITSIGFTDTGLGIAVGATITGIAGTNIADLVAANVNTINIPNGGAIKIGLTDAIRMDTTKHNVFVGGAGNLTVVGSYNVGNGYLCMVALTDGDNNVAFGSTAMQSNTTGDNNSAFGHAALNANEDGYGNAAFGILALQHNVSGYNNTALGTETLVWNTGNYNTACGMHALLWNTTGYNNTGCGAGALTSNTVGNQNTGIGMHAGGANTSGSDNFFGGYHCGFGDGTVNEQSQIDSELTLIGKYCTRDGSISQLTQLLNSIGIGYNTKVTKSNQVVIGNSSVLETILRGTVLAPTLRLSSIPTHANNAAALVAGLVVGDLYRTGSDPDPICIVH